MSATHIVLVHDGIQINMTPKMRTHLLFASLIYRAEGYGDDVEVYRIDDESNWDAVNAKLSELPMDELNINPSHAPVMHIEGNTPNFDAATPVADYAAEADVDIPEGDPLLEKVEAARHARSSEGRAFRVSEVAEAEAPDADELHDEVPDQTEEDEDDDFGEVDDTHNVLFNTGTPRKEQDDDKITLDSLLEDYTVYDPGEREHTPEETQKSWPEGWWAFADNHGIVAYFANERDAFGFRLLRINALLNFSDIKEREASAYRPD